MRFAPHTDEDVARMLEAIGRSSVDELFEQIPDTVRLDGPLELPEGVSEMEILADLVGLAARNRSAEDLVCFAGGGAYDHYVPAVVWALAGRSEFVTSYTPYQPELSQGVLQALFEYQSMICELTDMDQPLGCAVGNSLEVREAVETVRGEGPSDFTELVLGACAHLLALSDLGVDVVEGRRLAESAVADGSAAAAYDRWIRAQGGNPDLAVLPVAPVLRETRALRSGYVSRLGATAVGMAAWALGAGRATKEDEIDHAVGVVCRAKRGDAVEAGDVLAEVHARDEASADAAMAEVLGAYELADEAPPARPIVLDVLH